ncbi:FG-GAP repeat protein [Rudanella lutea]|uniref:FG-GAP repeat protein n=1 Tax=Rudanella lutea TaxID=451374 RepID=UPI00037B7E89|nr:FG-GAP repeat protein [Rudanella lutea]
MQFCKLYTTLALIIALLVVSPLAYAQIGIGGTPHSSAVLDLKGTNRAFYPPRLTTIQRQNLYMPQVGALVFDTDLSTLVLFDGNNWMPLVTTNLYSLFYSRTASDGASGDYFGWSVAISGDYAIAGAYGDDIGNNTSQGSAYVFVRSGTVWTQQAKLTASDGAALDYFGCSVAIWGDYAIVGAYGDDVGSNADQGSVYVFARSVGIWSQQAKIVASDGGSSDYFGESVSLSGQSALVGAYGDDVGTNADQGSAYVFLRSGTTWAQQTKLLANDGAANDHFGGSVSIQGDLALVGADDDDVGSNAGQGSAYGYLRVGTSWSQKTKLVANDGLANDHFGASVAVYGENAIVGATGDDIGSNINQGAAYVFGWSGTTWLQQAKLVADDGLSNDSFGRSVSISGDYVIVGASGDDVNGNTSQGSAYLFKRIGSTWTPYRKITDNAPANTNNGISVHLSNGTLIIGGHNFQTSRGKVAFGVVE